MSKALRGLGEGLASVGKTLLDDALLRRRDEMIAKLTAERDAAQEGAADRRLDKQLKAQAEEGGKDRASLERRTKMETDARNTKTTSVQIDDLTKINYNKNVDPVTGETTIGAPSSVEILDPTDGSREVIPWADYVRLKSQVPGKPGETPTPSGAPAPAPTPSAAPPPRPGMSGGIDTRTEEQKRREKLLADVDKVKRSGLLTPNAPTNVTVGGPMRYSPTS